MKMIVLALVVFAAYAAAAPSHDVYIDVARNILQHPERGRIAGGEYAEEFQFPHQVALRWGQYGTKSHLCGASIIGEKILLTAAHCKVFNYGNYDAIFGLLEYKRNSPIVVDLKLDSWRLHKGYPGGNVVSPYDIALIILDEALPFGPAIDKIALAREIHADYTKFDKATVSGWGYTSSSSITPKELRYVVTPRISNSQCDADLRYILGGRDHPLDDTMICTSNSKNNFKGTCGGDSGGCLFVEDNGIRYQIGVVSWGISPCATRGAPSVYTKVPLYLDWIAENSKN